MKKFIIAIEETCVQEFEVEANNADEAMEIVEKKYKNGEIILTPGECQYKQMSIACPNDEVSEWIEF